MRKVLFNYLIAFLLILSVSYISKSINDLKRLKELETYWERRNILNCEKKEFKSFTLLTKYLIKTKQYE